MDSFQTNSKFNVNFSGLTNVVGRKIFENSFYIPSLLERYPKSDCFVGNLPSSVINQIPKENRNTAIPEFFRTIRQAAVLLRDCKIEEASKILEKIGISGLEYINKGRLGLAYGFNLNNEKFVLKVFKDTPATPTIWSKNTHGPLPEINRGIVYGRYPDSERLKSMCGDLNGRWELKTFIDNTKRNTKSKKELDIRTLGLKDTDISGLDKGRNVINGIIIDHGGEMVVDKNLAENPYIRREFRKLTRLSPQQAESFIKKFLNSKEYNHEILISTVVKNFNALPEQNKFAVFSTLAANFKNKDALLSLISNIKYIGDADEKIKAFDMILNSSTDKEIISSIIKETSYQSSKVKTGVLKMVDEKFPLFRETAAKASAGSM